MRRVSRLLVVAACAALVPAAEATDAVWDALRTPGSVVVLRHSYAPGGFDPPDARLDDCSTQRNLDEHREGPPLVLVTHGSVVSELTGLNIRMGAFVVLRRRADGRHTPAGDLYVP